VLQSLLAGLKSFVRSSSQEDVPAERREPVRARCHLHVTLIEGEEARQATVTDLSVAGMRLRAKTPPKGKRFSVSHPNPHGEFELDTVRCEVLWSRKRKYGNDYAIGVSFIDDPSILDRSWVDFAWRTLGLQEKYLFAKRAHIRADASLPVDVSGAHGLRAAEGMVLNLGIGGLLMESRAELDRDERVRLHLGPWHDLPALDVDAMVLARRDGEHKKSFLYSIRFDEPSADQLKLLGKYVVRLLKESAGLY